MTMQTKHTIRNRDPGHGLTAPVLVTNNFVCAPSSVISKLAQTPLAFGARRTFGNVKMILIISGTICSAKSSAKTLESSKL